MMMIVADVQNAEMMFKEIYMLTNIFAVIGVLAVIYFILCAIKTFVEIKEDIVLLKENIEHLKELNKANEEYDD